MSVSPGLRRFLPKRSAIPHILILLGVLALALALTFSRVVRASYDQDEDQFIASARLLADHALLPYKDYPYFHTPYLTFIYAVFLPLAGHYNLLAARVFSLLCGVAAAGVLILVTRDLFRRHPAGTRLWAAAGIVLLLLPSPLFADASKRAWNHNFPVLLALLAFTGCYFSWRRRKTVWWLFASGLCLALAVGARLSFLTALPAFVVALLFFSPPGRSSMRPVLGFSSGFLVGLVPLLMLLLASPERFLFGNLGYPRMNTLFRFDVPPAYAPMTLSDKLGYLWNGVIAQPPNLLLFLSYWMALAVLCYGLWRRKTPRFEMALALLVAPCVAIGSFLPTPAWYQYFYAPVMFALIAISFGLSYLTRPGGSQARWAIVAFTEVVILANLFGWEDYRRMNFLLHPDTWRPLMFHNTGAEIAAALGDGSAARTPRVLTLGPLFPLEAGLDIYPAFATGPFAWRTAHYLSAERRSVLGVVSAADLDQYLKDSPPDGILVGFKGDEEFVEYARKHGYDPVDVGSDLRLWIRPSDEAP